MTERQQLPYPVGDLIDGQHVQLSGGGLSAFGELTVAADATKSLVFIVRKGVTLVGSAFADFDANTSTVAVDTTATTQSGGDLIDEIVVAKEGSDKILLNQELLPGEILTVSAAGKSGTGHDGAVALDWTEEF